MEVKIHVATLKIEEKEVPLTLKIAKQFPVKPHSFRFDRAVEGLPTFQPICKVLGKTIGQPREWMYLVLYGSDLYWEAPAVFDKSYEDKIVERGGWVDHPENVPTIVLG